MTVVGTAFISPCEKYRYVLSRTQLLDIRTRVVTFVMLNPSTADAEKNDPTITRCMNIAWSLGAKEMNVVNLYAYRTTYPSELFQAEDPVGPLNDDCIREALQATDLHVICGWGGHARLDRVQWFTQLARDMGKKLECLGTTNAGQPMHPLARRKAVFQMWNAV